MKLNRNYLGIASVILLVLVAGLAFNVPPTSTACAAEPVTAATTAVAGTGGVTAGLIVKLSAADTIVTASAAADKTVGVCESTAAAGGMTRYAQLGTKTTVTSGGAIAVGDLLTSDAAGKAVVATDGDRVVGVALTAAAAADAEVTIIITLSQASIPA